MPSEKRQRQDEGRLLRLEAERVAATRSQRSRQVRSIGVLIGAIVLVALAISIFSGDDDGGDVSTEGTGGTTTTVAEGAAVSIPIPAAGATIEGDTTCPAADGSAERTTTFAKAPPTCIDPAKTYTAVLETSEGDITIELDTLNAPVTANSFVVLARYHYFDGVAFHRIVPGFVNQAGDAVGPTPGVGGPGYTLPDELPADPLTAYTAGAVAMANSGADSGGSQFFLVIGDENGSLSGTGAYTVFGHVTAGQEVSEAINLLAVGESPTKVVTIDSVTITES